MDEKEYLKQRAKENYVKGLCLELVTEDTDISQLATNICEQVNLLKSDHSPAQLQKVVLGELSDCLLNDKKSQAANVADKIVHFICYMDTQDDY